MSSSVFFRFKSQKEPSRITFDGTGISVFELKRDIIAANKLGDGTDFELVISAEDTNEARRLPAAKAGRGGAARYVSGKMPQNAKASHKTETMSAKATNQTKPTDGLQQLSATSSAQTEEQKIAAMFQQGADQWAQQQQAMANATPVYRGPPTQSRSSNVPDKPLPPGYVCYRCGEKGHYIQSCPTNNDPEWDKRPRIKRTTGIPKSFLKTIEKPAVIANDGTVDDTKQPSGVMVTADGEWVIAEPDKAAWDHFQAKAKISAAAQEAAARGSKALREKGLECPIDNRLFVDPTKTPCCQTTCCKECITNSLLENDLTCPSCSTENILIDDLYPDGETAARIRLYEKEEAPIEASRVVSRSPNKKEEPGVKREQSESRVLASAQTVEGKKSPRATTPDSEANMNSKGRKRSADSELNNDRTPPGPSATVAKDSSSDGTAHAAPSTETKTHSNTSNQPVPTSKNINVTSQGIDAMAFPNMNSYMGMPMQMNSGIFNPAMMNPAALMNAAGNDWNSIWPQSFPQQMMRMPGSGFPTGMYPNTNYQQQNMQMPVNSGYNMNRAPGQGHGRGHFPNQQRNHFGGQNANDEDSAYFRKPVNPHRHQGRRNVNRPTDYREI